MRTATQTTYRERILAVLVHIQRHLDEPLPLDQLARVAHLSPHHFHRVFSGMVGESVHEHIRRLRLERAASRLLHTDHGVTRLAFEAGFETHEAFTRAFRAMFGMSPSAYRAEHRPPRLLGPAATGVHWSPDSEVPEFIPIEGESPMDVRIETVGPRRVAFVRHVGPYGSPSIYETWHQLCAWAAPRGLLNPQTLSIGVGHDDAAITPPEKVRYDACITVPADVQGEGDIGIQEIAGGNYATTTHVGPYEKLGETYAIVCGRWAPTSGHDLRAQPCFEIYRNFPGQVPPEQLITDIYVPVE